MSLAFDTIDAALKELDKLRAYLKRSDSTQVRSLDEVSSAAAVGHAWFRTHRSALEFMDATSIELLDARYAELISFTDKQTARTRYIAHIKDTRLALSALRTHRAVLVPPQKKSSDSAPSFASLTSDPEMQRILSNRWTECTRCLEARAALAAVVMMGGLLEGLLLAKINQQTNKTPVFTAPSAPKDDKGKTRKLQEWMLKNFIDVAHDLKWIARSTKDIGEVLRDYRNYIHPQKEYTHKIELSDKDAQMFWQISKEIIRQIL